MFAACITAKRKFSRMNTFRPLLSFFLLISIQPLFSQNALKSPDEFFPHKRGEQFTPHHQLTDYFEYLAANAPSTMRLEQYGKTNEDRPLQIAIFSSPENMARLEQIRLNNLRMTGLTTDGRPDLSNPVAIVWLSMSVHGNEPSGSECSPILAHRLAAQTDPQTREWLQNTVVIIDPSLNPDGYDRYTHWYRMAANVLKNPNPDSREHREPWPGGRPNHYYYDLNRDWAWATQAETQQRLVAYQRWMPHVHADLHEQYVNNPYYFAPAAEPMHDYITPWQRDFQTRIGENHARYFDQNGWLYFTKETFDLFYPSYGDTYPMFSGAIGMTYEQAGHSVAGRAIVTAIGDTLTLHDRIAHHLTTSLSTIEMGSKNAAKIVENFRDYYSRSATQPPGAYKAFVIRETNDPNKVNALCRFLDRHQIRYGRVGTGLSGVKAFDYLSGKETNVSINPNDLVISAYQPKAVLVEVLFEPEPRLSDSLTYDITAWAMPFAWGLDAYALKERLESKKSFEPYKAPEVRLSASPYAWCVHRRSIAEAVFLSEILQKGVKVRTATKPFAMADQQFDAGTFVINRGDNRLLANELDGMLKTAASKANVPLHPIFSGFSGKGSDLGSDAFSPIDKPSVALVYGDDVDENSFGHTWFFFERELGYSVSPVPLDKIHRVNLDEFTTLIVPGGSYSLTDNQLKIIQEWIKSGGRLIAFDGGVKAFAGKEGFEMKLKEEPKKDTTAAPKPYRSQERENISDQLPGAIVKAKVDNSHPLAFGFSDSYFSLKTGAEAYQMPDKANAVIYLEDSYTSYGFIGSRLKPRLKKTPVVVVQKMGGGQAVFFVDNPLFRSFWEQGKVLFANAVFY
ncbi:MAG: zinc carboxypeptidase [Haliscomenobacteraceae bacterium CHB4]|nr:zinc carboxypeptidase [Haliscomenobacteraceae bacterium CHB4]